MRRIDVLLAALLAGACLVATAHEGQAHKAGPVAREQKPWGIAAEARHASRTVAVSMSDHMRFTPDRIEVRQGETVKIVVSNSGAMLHEFVMGSRKTLDEHAALMVKFPAMEHDEPYMVHVKPGASAEIVWTFDRPGDFDFACLIPGHYQAGMVGKIRVIPAGSTRTKIPAAK
jgi:uncharacterized cupredoxin-like copper-binding protein